MCFQFETPVYGSNEPTFTEFMAPGVILSITYFMAVGLTSISFIIERKEGLLDRFASYYTMENLKQTRSTI